MSDGWVWVWVERGGGCYVGVCCRQLRRHSGVFDSFFSRSVRASEVHIGDGGLASDSAPPPLLSINISLKSIMSPLNEIKAKRLKSRVSQVPADKRSSPVVFPHLVFSLPLSALRERTESDLLNRPKSNFILWIVKKHKVPRRRWKHRRLLALAHQALPW